MKTSKEMASKPNQAKATTNGKPGAKPTGANNRTSASSQAARGGTAGRGGGTAARPGTGSRPANGTGRPTTGSRPGGARSRALPPQKKGFKMRPVDMIITGVAVLVIGLIVWAVWSSATPATTAGTAGDPNAVDASLLPNGTVAPDFTLPGNDGKTHSLSEFKGKPVFVEFMAPWCPHCQADAPIFNQVYDSYKDKVGMLAVNASPYGHNYENNDSSPITMDDLTWFAQNFSVKYPMLFDAPFQDAAAGRLDTNQRQAYGIEYFPTVYIIDKEGKVFDHVMADTNSPITYERVAAILDNALK